MSRSYNAVKGLVGFQPIPLASRLNFYSRQNGDCIEWTGPLDRGGYGHVSVGKLTARAHRASYEVAFGPIPAGLQIDHLCRNRACINPAHLEAVTPRENILRAMRFNGLGPFKTECKRGHAFTPENTYHYRGTRACRTCKVNSTRLIRQRAKL